MSLFLGYIHYMMYDKIQFQEEITQKILTLAENPLALSKEVDELGALPSGDLQEIIDPSNIHGWLQERVNLSERRLAFVCKALLDLSQDYKEKILSLAFEIGKSQNFSGTAEEAYEWMTTHFLDGMPCDGALMPLTMQTDHVVFEVMTDLHAIYWEEQSEFYWQIRSRCMEGLLEKSPYQFLRQGPRRYEMR